MRLRSFIFGLLATISVVANLPADLSNNFVEWGKGPAQYFLTKDEVKEWKSIETDADAKAFVDRFWARRDPTPATPANEFKDAFDQRVKFADDRYTAGRTKGSMTDRGRMVILIGPPKRVMKSGGSNEADPSASGTPPMETWYYDQESVPSFAGVKQFDLVFLDQLGNRQFKLASSRIPISTLTENAVKSYIVRQNPTVATPAPPPVRVVETTVPAAEIKPATSFKTDSLRAAFEAFKAAKTSAYKGIYLTYGEYVTASGDYFVPVQIYVPKGGSEVDATRATTFFGVIEDASGTVVAVYEEPAAVSTSKDDLYFDKSLMLTPGKYTGTFGLAADGKPLIMARANMVLDGVKSDTAGISGLLLSNNVYPLPQAQNPSDPFAFGGIKVVPKGDRVFRRADDLWFFYELRNPGLGEAGKVSIQNKVDVEGMAAGKKVRMAAPMGPAQAEELVGVKGHYGVGNSIPLQGFEPGDYSMKIKVVDVVTKQSYEIKETFKVVE